MRVHDSQAYRKMDVTWERISRTLEPREILLSIQIQDRPGVRQVPDGSGEQGKMEKTGCKIVCGDPRG